MERKHREHGMADGFSETSVSMQTNDGPMSAFQVIPDGANEAPTLCLFGGKDASIPAAEVEAIRTRLARQPREHQVIVYPDAGHGFFCDGRDAYDRIAAEDAWQRTRAWLELGLKALASYPTED
jgi:dienelactone hydrolase